MRVCLHVHVEVCIYVHICVCVHVRALVFVYLSVAIGMHYQKETQAYFLFLICILYTSSESPLGKN